MAAIYKTAQVYFPATPDGLNQLADLMDNSNAQPGKSICEKQSENDGVVLRICKIDEREIWDSSEKVIALENAGHLTVEYHTTPAVLREIAEKLTDKWKHTQAGDFLIAHSLLDMTTKITLHFVVDQDEIRR